jgi:uncharacterized protein YcaQ
LIELTLQQARCLQLAAQGMLQSPSKVATRAALRVCIQRMCLLQIDTIHVAARSPYLVLFSRLGAYPQQWLDEACFAPMDDLLAHRVVNREARKHWGLAHAQSLHAKQRAELDKLLAHIRENGPVKTSDFERVEGGGSVWWGWKDEKRWLEALFASGELMVVLGITQARWIHDYYRSKPRLKDADLNALVEQGALQPVAVEGWSAPGYVHASQAALLSPFDPIVWDRELAFAMFDLDYRLACYTPESRRIHGYFVLPILCRGELIGRLDAKAHRALGMFEVKALHAQPGAKWTASQIADVTQAIQRCAGWHATP